MNKRLSTLQRVALSTLSSFLILHSAVSYSDDTEIFFGGAAIDDSVRPNVLFVLDNSGSMSYRLDSNNTATGTQESRLKVLKDSFSSIISSAGAINAGVMILNTRSGQYDGRMVYPVTSIDKNLVAVNQIASTPLIRDSGDDATQSSLGSGAVINSTALQMGYVAGGTTTTPSTDTSVLDGDDAFFQSSYGSANWACRMNEPGNDHSASNSDACGSKDQDAINIRATGDTNTGNANPIRGTALLYFRNLNIPASAGLQPGFSAYLELRPANNQTNNIPTITTTLERSKTPLDLMDLQKVDPGRTYVASSNITASSWSKSSSSTINITNLLKDVLDDNAAPLQGVFLKLRATSNSKDYNFCTRNCGSNTAPRIVINYDKTAIVTEEITSILRFQDVGIPQGASIQTARLDFVPAAENPDPLTVQVRAEKVTDAATITAGSNVVARASKTTALTTWSAPVWTNVTPPEHVQGPDVTAVVQEVVNQGAWCGNNAMAFHLNPSAGTGIRTFFSIDGAKGLQPTLTVTYTGGTGGCLNPIIEQTVTSPKNDAYQQSNGSMVLDGATLPVDRSIFAARYEAIPILKNATILDTQLILTPTNTVNSPGVTTSVRFENAGNSAAFTGANNDLSARAATTNGTCVINSWVTDTPVICNASQLKSGLQSIVNRSDWAAGNAISVMSVQSSDSALDLQAYESNPAQSITLRIKVASGGIVNSNYTVRQHLNALVQTMTASGGTPLVPTYYEAAQYLKDQRTGYPTPITSACQATHVVLLTDGQANGYSTTSQTGITAWNGSSCTGDSSNSNEKCGRTLGTYLHTVDQSPFTGDNFITTNTIGFALGTNTAAQTFLTDIANNGGGTAYTAANAGELSAAFSKILQDVLSVDTTFVSPGATVNQFNRQSNKDEVYFALFKPTDKNRWVGNLKRYALGSGADIIVDADNVGAIDNSSGFFKSTARSFWTPAADGNDTALGGVAHRLPGYASRKAYTFLGASPVSPSLLTNSTNLLKDTNTSITQGIIGASDSVERTKILNWINGLNDDSTARLAVGDPLHSVPRLITYKCNTFTDSTLADCSSEQQSVFVGTNEGFVHAFDTNTGDEQMAFMPQELLGNIKALKLNAESTSLAPRKYGMDNTVALWVNDLNKNGVIYGGRDPSKSPAAQTGQLNGGGLNDNEFVYAYATMGRGGRNLYSLDVTDINSPKLRWYITPATPGFARLGQTWSTPVITKIDIDGTTTPVIMFAGGYDESQDDVNILNQNKNASSRTEDAYGNAIYIVNATTGALIWSGSSQATNASSLTHQQLTKMRYSMPSSMRAIDIDRDGLADQFFIGDMGGQVWRFFINNGNAISSLISPLDSGSGTTDDGVFASVIPPDTGSETLTQKKAKLRRFYNEPDISLLTTNSGKALVVNIGSGYRGHPLDTGAEDRFYSFRTPIIASNASHVTITESPMYDATLNLIQEGTASERTGAATAFAKNSNGWYIRMENSGEKVLSEATTFAGLVFFNTYEPNSTAANSSCSAVQGMGRSYAVSLFDATPPAQRVDGTPNRANRIKVLLTAGIPPKDVLLFRKDSDKLIKCTGTECEPVDADMTVGPTYWIDEL
jgi:type IV pilus assembly protein PilY1